jgi:hypothetical protein
MITLDGTIQRKFSFPSDSQTTLLYFSDLERVIFFLPHINIVETYGSDGIRIRFQTVELGAYTINVYCDLAIEATPDTLAIRVYPLEGNAPASQEATLNSTCGYGFFNSEAILADDEDGTTIDFNFRFRAQLPRPRGLRMMPKRVVDRIAIGISKGRMEEMIEGFMAAALESFPQWLEANGEQVARARS